jgi:hypothetical protein
LRLKDEQLQLVPASIRQVILHIGMPRTGSTYIQNMCETNRAALLEKGVLYPAAGHVRESGLRSFRTSGHTPWWHDGVLKNERGPVLEIRQEVLRNAAAHTVVLSTEDLFFMLEDRVLEKVATALSNTSTKIVVYLRRQDEWLESMYAEAVTGGYFWLSSGFEEYVDKLENSPGGMPIKGWPGARINLEYDVWLARLRNRFGKDALVVRRFQDPAEPGNLFANFLGLCGIGEIESLSETDPRARNVAFANREDVEVIRFFNKLPFDSDEQYRLFLGLYESWRRKQGPSSRPAFFKRSDRLRFLRKFDECNRLALAFLGNGTNELFAPPADTDPDADSAAITVERLETAYQFYDEAKQSMPSGPS